MLAPKDFTPEMLRPLAKNDYDWHPERSAGGPITMVVSAADKALRGAPHRAAVETMAAPTPVATRLPASAPTADEALQRLKAGNERFIAGNACFPTLQQERKED